MLPVSLLRLNFRDRDSKINSQYMPKAKTNKYIGKELDWLESRWQSLKDYVDNNPIEEMRDRVIQISTGKFMKDTVTATIENQIASVRQTLKEMPDLLDAIQSLREKNQIEEIQIKGDQEMPWIMRKKFEGQT